MRLRSVAGLFASGKAINAELTGEYGSVKVGGRLLEEGPKVTTLLSVHFLTIGSASGIRSCFSGESPSAGTQQPPIFPMPPGNAIRSLLFLSLLLFILYLYALHTSPTSRSALYPREDAEESYLRSHFNDSNPDAFEYFKATPAELEGRLYTGTWSTNASEGRVYMRTEDVSGSWPRLYTTYLQLYSGLWESDEYSEMKVEGCHFDHESKTLYMNDTIAVWKSKQWTVQGHYFYQKESVSGVISATNATWTLIVDLEALSPAAQLRPRQVYSLLMSGIYSLLVFALAKHSHDCSGSLLHARKTSMLFLLWNGVIDAVLAAWHMKEACEHTAAFYYMTLAAMWNGLVVMMVFSRATRLVWRAQAHQIDYDLAQGVMVVWSYVALVSITCALTVWPELIPTAAIALQGFFIPQIARNIKCTYRRSLSPLVYWPIALSRALFLGYHFACPANFLRYQPRPYIALVAASFLALQLLFLLLQDRIGVLWFIPKRYRAKYASPYYKTPQEEATIAAADVDCVICMTPLSLPGAKNVSNSNRTLHAPCGHRFHSDCLGRWLDMKPDCPTCRANLPPVTDS